mgnify:CR=1 FL=1
MYNTALTLIEMLSRVITSCGGMSIAMTRSETFCILANIGGRKINPGPLAAQDRPRKKYTRALVFAQHAQARKQIQGDEPMRNQQCADQVISSGRVRFDDHRRALAAADARRRRGRSASFRGAARAAGGP